MTNPIYYNISLPIWLIKHDILCDQNGDIRVFCDDFSFEKIGNTEKPLAMLNNTERFIFDRHLRLHKHNDISFILGKIPNNFLANNVKALEYTSDHALLTVFDMNRLETEKAKIVMLIYATLFFHKQGVKTDYKYSLEQVRAFIKELPIYLIIKER